MEEITVGEWDKDKSPINTQPKQWQKNHKKCKKCGTTNGKYAAKGLCQLCYHRYYWKNNPQFREKHKVLVYKWQKEHPERWKEIVYKALRKYQIKNKEKINEYYRKRYEKKKAKSNNK